MATEILVKAVPSRVKPQPVADNQREGQPLRGGRYGELYTESVIPTKHLIADEGSYFTTNNQQTAIATVAAASAFADTTSGFVLLYNGESSTSSTAKRYYLDYLRLAATVAGAAGTNVQFAVRIDNGNRYASAGTNLTSNIVNVNGDDATKSAAQVYAGTFVATAKTAAQRFIVGNAFLKGAIVAVGDNYMITFGAVDNGNFLGLATSVFVQSSVPPAILGPNQSLIIDYWAASQSGATSFLPELSWWER